MADIIRQLPDTVANQIAAGEVIQRPSSVIKELVENSADAGATEINIVVADGGRALIQVTDNGKGMSPTDARMAFERHATSKITQASDLFNLHTMGFRGEALPSICAIAQVELRSAEEGAAMGTKLIINGAERPIQEPCVCPKGTTIMVKNIFFNVPARRRFLREAGRELTRILHEFEIMALVNHNIRFTFESNGKKRDYRAGSFKQRITDLWKGTLKSDLLPVEVDTDLVRISGFISRPENARRRNALQYLIANGRYMRHPYFNKAILSCFERLIAPDTQPCYFLRFEVDPGSIDVNIHPAKSEIKFEHEQEIYKLLASAVQATLGKYSVVPSIDFTADALEVTPVMPGQEIDAPPVAPDLNYNPFAQERKSASSAGFNNSYKPYDWQELYNGFKNASPGYEGQPTLPLDMSATVNPIGNTPHKISKIIADMPEPVRQELPPICLQLDRRYIVTPGNGGLMIIDQHRAHVSVLYNEFLNQTAQTGPISGQNVLFGEELRLDERQRSVLAEALPKFREMGITLQEVKTDKENVWVIKSLPTVISDREGRDIILHTLDSLQMDSESYGRPDTTSDDLRHRVALSLARSAAIRRGQTLSQPEMEKLLSSLMKLPDPAYGPDGCRVIFIWQLNKITTYF